VGAVHSIKSGKAQTEQMMSAFHPIATEQQTQFYVGFVPKADVNLNITSARLWLPNTPISPATPQPARTWRRSLSAAQPKQWYP
jgi:hypothetical protein